MVAIVNEYADANEEAVTAIAVVAGRGNSNNVPSPSPSTSAIANSDSFLDVLYVDISMDAGSSDANSEEYDAVMREIE